jgi:hypothetical protein
VILTMGALVRGAHALGRAAHHLRASDILVVNCAAEVEIAERFFENARVALVPFAIDGGTFFPLPAEERAAVRARLGFGERDRVLLYSGRITAEKNVHTLLRVVRAVQEIVPDVHLVLAGQPIPAPFREFGVVPVGMSGTIGRAIGRLGLRADSVRMMGRVDAAGLRELYNAAELVVNLTLHHDENFGLAQVEAMACGTPVVGTRWGGLKDTVADGVTGKLVSTVVTEMGVKASWWGAVNEIVALLEDDALRERMGGECVRWAAGFGRERYRAAVDDALARAAAGRGSPPAPLRATAFARELWTACPPGSPHRPGERSYDLYRELIAPFAGSGGDILPAGAPLEPGQVLVLANPVARDGDGRRWADDPLYPFAVDVPAELAAGVDLILATLRDSAAATVAHVAARCAGPTDALHWMLGRGLVLRSPHMEGWIAPERVSQAVAEPLFSFTRIDVESADFIVY